MLNHMLRFPMIFTRPVLFAAYMGLGIVSSAAAEDQWTWQSVGIGGGGRFLNPGISPHDPAVLLCGSDMGGVYRSEDGGAHWAMLPQSMIRRLHFGLRHPHHSWTFHPVDPNLVFVGTAFGFKRSDDAGKTWAVVDGPWDQTDSSGILTRHAPRVTVFDPADPDVGVAVVDITPARQQIALYRTVDRGCTWEVLPLPSISGRVINLLCFNSGSRQILLLATTEGVWRSEDGGHSWSVAVTGLPKAGGLTVFDFDGAARDGVSRLYATATTADDKELERRWVYVSTDGARTWHPIKRTGVFSNPVRTATFGLLGVSASNPDIVYVTAMGGDLAAPEHPGQAALYRSDNGGATWTPVWYHNVDNPNYNVTNDSWLKGQWGWNYAPAAIDVDPSDPNRVFATTISSALVTEDGGKTWRQVHAPDGSKKAQPTGGMMVTSSWNYYIHPKEEARRFIALTDFSGWRSLDAGHTWQYRTEGNPWHNNTYAMALDPDLPDVLWAACSVTHDIPTWRYQANLGKYVGGVVMSINGGASWVPVGADSGLPRKAVTDIWLDPASAQGSRVLWAAVPGEGAFISEDNGTTWQARNQGISPDNLNVLRVHGDGEGRLFALTTVRVRGGANVPGALYLSTDSGRSWEKIFSEREAPFLANFTLDPSSVATVYVTALHTNDLFGTAVGGGVWKSQDNGRTWTHVFDKPAYAVTVDPRDADRLYVSCWYQRGDGLYQSDDGGRTWARIDSYPYWRPLMVVLDPSEPDSLYVTNFGGGVFRGTRNRSIMPSK